MLPCLLFPPRCSGCNKMLKYLSSSGSNDGVVAVLVRGDAAVGVPELKGRRMRGRGCYWYPLGCCAFPRFSALLSYLAPEDVFNMLEGVEGDTGVGDITFLLLLDFFSSLPPTRRNNRKVRRDRKRFFHLVIDVRSGLGELFGVLSFSPVAFENERLAIACWS